MLSSKVEVAMKSVSGDTNRVRYAVTSLPASSNQDFYSVNEDHVKNGIANLSSFGVFDGHVKEHSAKYCAKNMHKKIVETFNHLLKINAMKINRVELKQMLDAYTDDNNEPQIASMIDSINCFNYVHSNDMSIEDQVDNLLTEAIQIACSKMDDYLKNTKNCGTTMNSLFVLFNHIDGSHRVTCANIGDSRCVMVVAEQFTEDNTIPGIYIFINKIY